MRFLLAILLLFGFPPSQLPQMNGIKVTVRNTMGTFSTEQTTYYQGDRKRIEMRTSEGRMGSNGSTQMVYGPHVAIITRCDLGQYFAVNLDAAEYTSTPYPSKALMDALSRPRPAPPPVPPKATFRIETSTVDTGERKEIFGHTARHVIIARKQTPLDGSHQMAQDSVTDGWYIDLNTQLSCDPKFHGAGYVFAASMGPNHVPEIPEFVDIGKPDTGFPLQQVTTTNSSFTQADGTTKQMGGKSELQVTEFQEGPLDPALFEISSKFKLVAEIQINPAPPSQMEILWERFKTRLSNLFSL
jgi:hypothetical protein